MASIPGIVQADEITKEDFSSLLEQYPALIKSISDAKGAKDGQKTLLELDSYRYNEALETFQGDEPQRSMNLQDVKTLVEWKLRHGKFRPTLMKLVSSNDPAAAAATISQARAVYRQDPNPQAALDILTKLKGIGPATASLLLTVHDPDRVIFFSDEAFYWLCCGARKSPIKYSAKEYKALATGAQALCERLDVRATDVEKVAYVLLSQSAETKSAPASSKVDKKTSKPVKKAVQTSSSKRKPELKSDIAVDVATETTTLRRSKRTRA